MNKNALARACADAMWRDDSASRALGIEIDVSEAGSASARMTVRPDMVNGLGVCHGGLVFTLADTAFAFACNAYDEQSFAASCHIDFLRPASAGDELIARATEDYRGARSGYYTVRVHDQHDRPVALFRGRCATKAVPMLSQNSDTENIEKTKKE